MSLARSFWDWMWDGEPGRKVCLNGPREGIVEEKNGKKRPKVEGNSEGLKGSGRSPVNIENGFARDGNDAYGLIEGHRSGESRRGMLMRERYDDLVLEMKERYGFRVRKWRSSSSGCAWAVRYTDGTARRWLESPRPRGPVSCAIFLHEVGHHAIGLGRYRPRCLEEYHAWMWSLAAMRRGGFNVTGAVEKRVEESLKYAVRKARRRGLKVVPGELRVYVSR